MLKRLVKAIQSNFEFLKGQYFFIKLSKENHGTSRIAWVKSFTDVYALGDYYYDTQFRRAGIMIKFDDDHFDLLFEGFWLCDRINIWSEKVSEGRPVILDGNTEKHEMLSREALNAAFSEIREELNLSRRDKAM